MTWRARRQRHVHQAWRFYSLTMKGVLFVRIRRRNGQQATEKCFIFITIVIMCLNEMTFRNNGGDIERGDWQKEAPASSGAECCTHSSIFVRNFCSSKRPLSSRPCLCAPLHAADGRFRFQINYSHVCYKCQGVKRRRFGELCALNLAPILLPRQIKALNLFYDIYGFFFQSPHLKFNTVVKFEASRDISQLF